jgi:dTDP-glucose 4,6-dehydratase
MRFLITGGCGFIGSAFVRHLITDTDFEVLNLDKLTYAGSPLTVAAASQSPRYQFRQIDIAHANSVRAAFTEFRPVRVVHLAAESHVDRSIDFPGDFIQTNVVGTYTMLEEARRYWMENRSRDFRFLHVSTDEVFGSLGPGEFFDETTPYNPSSPYSASKASADHLARSWHRTYGFPVIVTNCSNNYGPYQFPEKLIPLMIEKALANEPMPVYGDGQQVRDWLHVEDHVAALLRVLVAGQIGQTYLIGGESPRCNLEIVQQICDEIDRLRPDSKIRRRALIQFVTDRPGHDVRYAMNIDKTRRELGWQPSKTFEQGLRETITWYLDNVELMKQVVAGRYQGQRLGQSK